MTCLIAPPPPPPSARHGRGRAEAGPYALFQQLPLEASVSSGVVRLQRMALFHTPLPLQG